MRIFCELLLICLFNSLIISVIKVNCEEKGPTILTPYIESNDIEYARKLCRVKEMVNSNITDVESYSGFFTIDKRYDSHLFFWFFPSQVIQFIKLLLILIII